MCVCVCVCVWTGRLWVDHMMCGSMCRLSSRGLRLFVYVCFCRQVVCVHVCSGRVKAAVVALRGTASPCELIFTFGPEYDQICIFSHRQ